MQEKQKAAVFQNMLIISSMFAGVDAPAGSIIENELVHSCKATVWRKRNY